MVWIRALAIPVLIDCDSFGFEIDLTGKKEGIIIEKEVLEKNDKVGKNHN